MKDYIGNWENTGSFLLKRRNEKYYIWKCKNCGCTTEQTEWKIKERGFPKCDCGKLNKEYKTIPGYEDYEITIDGNVWSKKKHEHCSTYIDKDGYIRVNISPNVRGLHQLLALTFIPNPNNYPMINHKDENKSNNSLDNLEWCTAKYNSNYGTLSERKMNTKRNIKIIREDGVIYNSIHEAARENKLQATLICAVLNGRRKKTGGYSWSYYEND